MGHASYRGRYDEGALRLVEVLLGALHEPQVRLDVHIEGAVPLLLVAVVVDAREAPDPRPPAVGE